jgi:hypothetical protein
MMAGVKKAVADPNNNDEETRRNNIIGLGEKSTFYLGCRCCEMRFSLLGSHFSWGSRKIFAVITSIRYRIYSIGRTES